MRISDWSSDVCSSDLEGPKEVSSTSYVQASASYNRTFAETHGVSGMLVFIMNNIVDANMGDLQRSLPHRNLGLSGRFTYHYVSRSFGEFNFGYNGSDRLYRVTEEVRYRTDDLRQGRHG